MPTAIPQPTVTVRVYAPTVPTAPDGTRQRDLTIYRNAQFTRQRNTIGTFEISIPLVPFNLDLLNEIREGWMFEFWSEADQPAFLFGGFVNSLRWSLEAGQTLLTVRGLSYLAWLGQRKIIGGTGSLPWKATLGGLENPAVGGYRPPVNQIMYHALTYGGGASPWTGISPPGTPRAHPAFRIPNLAPITHVTEAWSKPAYSGTAASQIPRLTAMEITAFMSGIEAMNSLVERVGDRVEMDPTSLWFGMPRISYDIIRYDGIPAGTFPTGALYLVIRIPGLGVNRTVGNTLYDPIIFDVDGGGVSEGEYVEDAAEIRNWIYALGEGENATRLVKDGDSNPTDGTPDGSNFRDDDSIGRFGRIEEVMDGGQEANQNVLLQKAKDVLNERREMKVTARFRLDAIPGQVFGTDFFFDDAVTVYWNDIGLVLNDFVTAVSLSVGGDEGGSTGIQRAEVTVGNEKLASREGGQLGRYLSGLKRGISNLRI